MTGHDVMMLGHDMSSDDHVQCQIGCGSFVAYNTMLQYFRKDSSDKTRPRDLRLGRNPFLDFNI